MDIDKSRADDLPGGLNYRGRRDITQLPHDLYAVVPQAKIGLKARSTASINYCGVFND
ncbi:MAG: hypothetical protein ABIJ25_13045 [Pseudomonadota bacterium]